MKSVGFALNDQETRKCENGSVFSLPVYIRRVSEQEDIHAVVISTYRVCISALQRDFPSLFDKNRPIPTLVLHGEKGVLNQLIRRQALKELGSDILKHIYIWEVLPQFPSIQSEKVRPAMGVHHPKYVLIFTKSGFHFIVTTANFNGSICTDGAWCHFFPRREEAMRDYSASVHSNDFGIVLVDFLKQQSMQLNKDSLRNEFNRPQSKNASSNQIFSWLKTYTDDVDILQDFDYSGVAEIRLVSTVPCRQPLAALTPSEVKWIETQSQFNPALRKPRPCETCREEAAHMRSRTDEEEKVGFIPTYGSQRIHQLLREHSEYLESAVLGQLIVQQTSIGQSINNEFMDSFLKDYMPERSWDENAPLSQQRRETNYHIVWPTLPFMNYLNGHNDLVPNKMNEKWSSLHGLVDPLDEDDAPEDGSVRETQDEFAEPHRSRVSLSPSSIHAQNSADVKDYAQQLLQQADEAEEELLAKVEEREHRKGILFFQPEHWTQMEADIQAQFAVYNPLILPTAQMNAQLPQQQKPLLRAFQTFALRVPHIKTYSRLLLQPPVQSPDNAAAPIGTAIRCASNPSSQQPQRLLRRQFIPPSSSSPTVMMSEDTKPSSNTAPRASQASAINHTNSPAATVATIKTVTAARDADCTCTKLAWSLLTSACLSGGAQGRRVPYSLCADCGHIRQGYHEYRNFELGVFFCSDVHRQYVALSPHCPVHFHTDPHRDDHEDDDSKMEHWDDKNEVSRRGNDHGSTNGSNRSIQGQTTEDNPSCITTISSVSKSNSATIANTRCSDVSTTSIHSGKTSEASGEAGCIIPLPLPFHIAQLESFHDAHHRLRVCPYFHLPQEISKYVSEYREMNPFHSTSASCPIYRLLQPSDPQRLQPTTASTTNEKDINSLASLPSSAFLRASTTLHTRHTVTEESLSNATRSMTGNTSSLRGKVMKKTEQTSDSGDAVVIMRRAHTFAEFRTTSSTTASGSTASFPVPMVPQAKPVAPGKTKKTRNEDEDVQIITVESPYRLPDIRSDNKHRSTIVAAASSDDQRTARHGEHGTLPPTNTVTGSTEVKIGLSSSKQATTRAAMMMVHEVADVDGREESVRKRMRASYPIYDLTRGVDHTPHRNHPHPHPPRSSFQPASELRYNRPVIDLSCDEDGHRETWSNDRKYVVTDVSDEADSTRDKCAEVGGNSSRCSATAALESSSCSVVPPGLSEAQRRRLDLLFEPCGDHSEEQEDSYGNCTMTQDNTAATALDADEGGHIDDDDDDDDDNGSDSAHIPRKRKKTRQTIYALTAVVRDDGGVVYQLTARPSQRSALTSGSGPVADTAD